MTFSTPNNQAIGIANNLIVIAQDLAAQKVLIDQYATQFTQLTLGTTYEAMTTIAINADGTFANTPDVSPNHAHPIDPSIYTFISRSISAADIESLNTLLQAVSTLLSGAPVTQQGQAPQLLAKLVG